MSEGVIGTTWGSTVGQTSPRLAEPINIADLERLAADVLDAGAHGYFAGGAGDERTLRRNVEAFAEWELWPRVLVDVSEVSTRTEVLGKEVELPVLVAPVAFQRLAHPDGEQAMARAAQAAGTVMLVSMLATTALAEVAAAAPGGRRWMQLYCFRDRGVTRALIEQATEAGYEAIALTVDAPYAGPRERDLRTGFALPGELRTPAIDAAVGSKTLTVAEVFGLVDPSLTWSDLEALLSDTDLPILVKGVMGAADAELAVEHGAAGVIVSNHGGRQLDAVAASIDILPEVVEAVGGRIEVLMDGGVRRGSDVATALAIGAGAVLVGRPALWGLAVDGQAGAERALAMLGRELELALALLGCASPTQVTRSHARRRRT
jgi:isopentenyl diphosphate isomerase/L-lactate dehydrogenase-like FMN-dependent dehydrogenase